jgi:uncharacterized protein with HEPN domain
VIKRPHLIRLRDILENIDAVADMMAGIEFEAYRRDVKLRRAVERCVEIVSEASRSAPDRGAAEEERFKPNRGTPFQFLRRLGRC